VAVVDFREMVERAGLLGEGKPVFSSLVFDFEEPLLDVNVRSPVLAQGAEFHEMAFRSNTLHGPKNVESANNVVNLREDGTLVVHHRVGGRWLFAIMDDGVGFEGLQRLVNKIILTEIAGESLDFLAGDFLPRADPLV